MNIKMSHKNKITELKKYRKNNKVSKEEHKSPEEITKDVDKFLKEYSKNLYTVEDQRKRLNYLEKRKSILDEGNPDNVKPNNKIATDEYVSSINIDVIKKQRSVLRNILSLKKLSKFISEKHCTDDSSKSAEIYIKRANKAISDTNNSIQQKLVQTSGLLPSLKVNNILKVLDTLNPNAKTKNMNNRYMILFCKAIISHYAQNTVYFNTIINAYNNIPIFIRLGIKNHKAGITESETLIKSTNIIYNQIM